MKDYICEMSRRLQSPEISKRTKIGIGILMAAAIFTAIIVVYNFAFADYVIITLHPGWIHVHLIPHSHDDVGWLKTPEDYYHNYVKYILNHVIIELQKCPSRKFVYSETYFLWNWWQEQSETVRELVRHLIERKQLEIVGGGWCMGDEAVTHYQSFIDQSTWGFRRLNDTLGPIARPTVGWQIDTFGHSKGIASLLAQMGFNSLFFARIDLNERRIRKSHKQMEFIWTGNKNLGDSGTIFTSVFYDHYSAPKGFDFETQASDSPIRYDSFANYVRRQAQNFYTDNILVPMGDDFRFLNAKKYFQRLDLLVRFFQENPAYKLRVFYSTPSGYVESLRHRDVAWPVKEGDFFPYASEPRGYWTGFYTSRPTLKYFERISNNMLQVVKQLLVFSQMGMMFFNELTSLREAVGVLQHHDAITGTSQQDVTDHYSELLYEGIDNCKIPADHALKFLSHIDLKAPTYQSCLLLNISACDLTERASRFVVTVYNPLSRTVDHYVRIPVTGRCYSVLTAKGSAVMTQVVVIPESVRNIPGRQSQALRELLFKITEVPAMGFRSFYVIRTDCTHAPKHKRCCLRKKMKAVFSRNTKQLSGVKTNKGDLKIGQTIGYYRSTPHLSGAYLFSADGDVAYKFKPTSTKLLNNGLLVKEYEQKFTSWVSQIMRVYEEEEYLEFEWLVGPIPVEDFDGKEVVIFYNSTIKNGKAFYTDVNGMEMQKRVRDCQSRMTKILEKVSSNYYPVTTMISIKDDNDQLYVVVDRPQGGSSLQSGEIQLMVHRRLCYDDGKGVEEPLNETAFGRGLVARGRHWVLFGDQGPSFQHQAKLFSQTRHSEPWLFFLDADDLPFDQWRTHYLTEFSGLHSYVPRNVRILTLEPWREDKILVRFEHVLEKVPALRLDNTPEDISLKDLFKDFDVLEARETTLGADRWLSHYKRPKWRKHTYRLKENKEVRHITHGNMTISLKPQEIRTFILTVKAKA